MDDALEKRIEALERAITDGEHDLSALATDAEATERLTAVESRLDGLDDRVAELEAATQALRGYVGNIRSVNRDVEKRADTALAKAESLESAMDIDEASVERQPEPQESSSVCESRANQRRSTPKSATDSLGPSSARTRHGTDTSSGGSGDTAGNSTDAARHSVDTAGKPPESCCRACGQPTVESSQPVSARGSTRADGGTVGRSDESLGLDSTTDSTGSTDSRNDGGTLQRIRNLL